MLLVKLFALQLAWFGCLPIYLSAKQQVFLATPLSKQVAWGLFTLSSIVSTILLAKIYHPLTSAIFVLVIWMTTWILLALCGPMKPNVGKALLSGSLFALLIGVMGGPNVV